MHIAMDKATWESQGLSLYLPLSRLAWNQVNYFHAVLRINDPCEGKVTRIVNYSDLRKKILLFHGIQKMLYRTFAFA